jgi:hypothetical protein
MRNMKRVVSDDELFKKWSEWMDRIYQETIALAANRQMFRRIAKMFEKNKRLQEVGGHVWDWLKRNYVDSATMSMRRELDRQPKTQNLRHLLQDIKTNPKVISRNRYRAMWPLDGMDKKVQEFQKLRRELSFDSFHLIKDPRDEALDYLDPSIIKADLEALTAATERVRTYIEQVVAHRTGSRAATVTFDDFDAAVDAVQEIFKKYYLLLTQTSIAQFEPVPQFDIDAPFRFAWLPANGATDRVIDQELRNDGP